MNMEKYLWGHRFFQNVWSATNCIPSDHARPSLYAAYCWRHNLEDLDDLKLQCVTYQEFHGQKWNTVLAETCIIYTFLMMNDK